MSNPYSPCSPCSAASRVCIDGLNYVKKALTKEPKTAILSCEGACIKGEVARVAANMLAYRLRRDTAVRICLGDAATGNSGMVELITRAPKVISIEGCPLSCGMTILKKRLPELQATIVDASQLYSFDRNKCFEIFDLPKEQIEEYAINVAKHIEHNCFRKTIEKGGAFMQPTNVTIISTEHWVEHDGIRLCFWEKCQENAASRPVIVLAHGSATAGRESFDLQIPGKPSYSLMDYLATEGFDVFAPDIRGFGRSTHPEGHMTTAEASEDLNAVVDYILRLRGIEKVNLLAWSWGTQYGGMFIMAHPEKTAKYVSYAQMHVDSPDIAKRRPRVESFRRNPYVSIPETGWKGRFYSMTPTEANDSEVVDSYAKAAAGIELQTPTGPQLDMVTILPMVNPRLLPIPTMVIYGEHDDVADTDGLLPFFQQLPNPYKRYVVIPDAGHMLHLQKGHRLFQHEVASFFKAPLS